MGSRTLLAVNNYYYPRGGAEVVFLEQNRLFERAGWQVVPFCMRHAENLASEWDEYFVDELEFGSGYSLFQSIKRVPKVIYSLEAQKKLSRLIELIRPDACLLHNIYHHISPSILSTLRDHAIPTIMTLHDLKLGCPAYKMLANDGICERCKGGQLRNVIRHRCVKNSLALSAVVYVESKVHRALGTYEKCVDKFIVPSKFFATKLAEWGISADKMVHVPNFVNLADFEPSTQAGKYFLYFGRLAPEKGLSTLIKASAAAGVRLKIVGTGPDEALLQTLAAQLGHPVEFEGYLSGATLHEAIRGARAVVLPSEWYENAPVSVLEAYALGVPVIGADIGGIPEMVRPGETGQIVASADVPALSDVLGKFAAAADEPVHAMGMAGRAWAGESFSTELHMERVQAVLAQIGLR